MSRFPATKARRVFAALLRIGRVLKRQSGSHRTLTRDGWPDLVFHDDEELGPVMLARIAKRSGLLPEDYDRAATKASYTGQYLKPVMARKSAAASSAPSGRLREAESEGAGKNSSEGASDNAPDGRLPRRGVVGRH